jgi:hypothetical protein
LISNLTVTQNGNSGLLPSIRLGGTSCKAFQCIVHDVTGPGILLASSVLEECELYNCNQGNNASQGAITASGTIELKRCLIHNNTGSNNAGLFSSSSLSLFANNSVFARNQIGCSLSSSSLFNTFSSCDFYANVGDALALGGPSGIVTIENCNFCTNGGFGINGVTDNNSFGHILNCGFGTGADANVSGDTQKISALIVSGSISYGPDTGGTNPWMDPNNGDFRCRHFRAFGAGRGSFTETAAGYSGTVGYPDIGAAQHPPSDRANRAKAKSL